MPQSCRSHQHSCRRQPATSGCRNAWSRLVRDLLVCRLTEWDLWEYFVREAVFQAGRPFGKRYGVMKTVGLINNCSPDVPAILLLAVCSNSCPAPDWHCQCGLEQGDPLAHLL